jgi:zinc protease
MRTIQKRYYVPNNSVLIITGDVHADEVFKCVDELYAGWAKAPDPFVKFPLVTHPPIPRSEAVVVTQPVQTFTAIAEWLGPSTIGPSAPATYASDLLTSLVSDPGSKFQKALVDSGACVGANLAWRTERDQAPVMLIVEAQEANADTCLSAAFAELKKIEAPDYFSDDELKNAAHTVDIGMATERERTDGYAHQLSYFWANATLDYYKTYVDGLRSVTRADIAKFLDTYVLGKRFVLGALESQTLAQTNDKAHLEKIAGIGGAKPAPAAAMKKGGAK